MSNLPRILSQLPVPKMLLSFIAGGALAQRDSGCWFAHHTHTLRNAGLAGVLAKTAVAPLDRTKIMFQVTHRPFTIPAAIALMKDIVTREGPAGLFKGNTAAVLRCSMEFNSVASLALSLSLTHFLLFLSAGSYHTLESSSCPLTSTSCSSSSSAHARRGAPRSGSRRWKSLELVLQRASPRLQSPTHLTC